LSIQAELLDWFDAHRRDLPWRHTNDPYAIWVSEVMLQQTQVATVIPYFERWMRRFPTVCELAQASESEVLEHWQGLGYYRRARGLLAGARQIALEGLPRTAAEWVRLPGIGRYTAGAIASIAFGETVPLVDGNVERVYARLSADGAVDAALHKSAWQWAADAVDRNRPGDWNQALMELGATVCKPVAPICNTCPIASFCAAFGAGIQNELPTPTPKTPTKRLTHHVWIPVCEGRYGIRQIPEGQWWAGMWEFPRSELVEELAELMPDSFPVHIGSFSHSVTTHRIRVHVSTVRLESPLAMMKWAEMRELESLPMPAPQRRALGLLA
jgi:A/G-specific adenine glycosylase